MNTAETIQLAVASAIRRWIGVSLQDSFSFGNSLQSHRESDSEQRCMAATTAREHTAVPLKDSEHQPAVEEVNPSPTGLAVLSLPGVSSKREKRHSQCQALKTCCRGRSPSR